MATARKQQDEPQEKIEDAYHKTEEATLEAVGQIKEKVMEEIEAGQESLRSATDQAGNFVKERPLLSVGCAFLAGWAISKLIK
ncbi:MULTISPECIES: hypothetical protein [Vibrio]|uniref:DUF883 domain-containing protein n=1 Tax=Vibrio ostreae TaxID=2841925 RepID=A0A975U8J7_9VIBR|nr:MULTISPECIES: hypothetical protein [Vibrio]QXO16596.1 hypothetical protein KNV97_13990 [Vibrio ostreae]WGY46395.1 hypothetical protein J0X00_16400 [Vibrio sp. ABG19]